MKSQISRLMVALLVVLGVMPFSVSAQSPSSDEVDEWFTLYSKTHVLTRPANASLITFDVEVIKQAINRSVSIFGPLWEQFMPDIWLELIPTTDGPRASAAYDVFDAPVPGNTPRRFSRRPICRIQVYNKISLEDASGQQFIIAHEMAHCYQYKLVPITRVIFRNDGTPAPTAQLWWAEGSATWLATKVYSLPNDNGVFSRLSGSFAQHHGDSLLGSTDYQFAYDALFFWEALDRSIGTDRTLKFLMRIPEAINDQQQYITQLQAADLLFNNYGLFAAWGDLNYQPPAEGLFLEVRGLDAIPGTTPAIPIKKFSINPLSITLPANAQRGISLKATGLTASGVTVRLLSGETLRDGVEVHVCGLTSPKLNLVASRTSKGQRDTIQFSVSAFDCPAAAVAPISDCYLGVWHLEKFPGFGASALDITLGGDMELTIKVTGATILRFKDFSTTTNAAGKTFKSTLSGTLLNNIRIDRNGNATGSQTSGIETVTASITMNGQPVTTVNMAEMLQQVGGGITNSRLVCDGDKLQEFVSIPGVRGPYVFKR